MGSEPPVGPGGPLPEDDHAVGAKERPMKKADVKRFRFHNLRHTFATRLVQAGEDIDTVQKLGRWKTISMVMRYAHHHPESLRAGIEILDRVLAGVSTVLALSANHAVAVAGSESAVSC